MAENDGSSSQAPVRPTITLPPRTSIENMFTGEPSSASPGPMTLVSRFFNDPDSECRSFSQLLAGAMTSPAMVPPVRQRFQQPGNSTSSAGKENGNGGGDVDFRFKQNRPTGLAVSQSAVFTVPPGLSPASLLDSPGFFSTSQGSFGLSHQQALAQITAQAAQAQPQLHIPPEFSSFSSAPAPSSSQIQSRTSGASAHQQMPPPRTEFNVEKESSDVSNPDQRSQPCVTVDKPADDGYNWRKYGQKQVKGSEYPRSYYKCTHANCPVKKKVERSHEGQVTEIIYKGQHNHQPPQPIKRGKDSENANEAFYLRGNSESGPMGTAENLNKYKEGFSIKDHEFSQATPEQTCGSSESEEAGDAENGVDGRDDDEPEAKRRNMEVRSTDIASSSSHRTVTEPRIIVQTTSEVDLLDDGYRWRKYGQKVVKGNPYPRSYYKCTSQGCNVRKHVERAASDPKAVITTYEGKHNHDVPAAKNSSHATANMVSQLRPQNSVPVDNQSSAPPRQEYGSSRQQQGIASLRFKEEQMT